MIDIINALLDLWDPYGIYLFPKDEYSSYATEIERFIKARNSFDAEELSEFVFSILPPIEFVNSLTSNEGTKRKNKMDLDRAKNDKLKIFKVEYLRFAQTLKLIFNKCNQFS